MVSACDISGNAIRLTEMKGRFLLDIAVIERTKLSPETLTQGPGRNSLIRECPPVFELLPGENETLLIRRNPLLVLDFSFDVVNRVRRLHFQRNRLAGKGLHEDLHSTTKAKDEMERRLFLDIAGKCDSQYG